MPRSALVAVEKEVLSKIQNLIVRHGITEEEQIHLNELVSDIMKLYNTMFDTGHMTLNSGSIYILAVYYGWLLEEGNHLSNMYVRLQDFADLSMLGAEYTAGLEDLTRQINSAVRSMRGNAADLTPNEVQAYLLEIAKMPDENEARLLTALIRNISTDGYTRVDLLKKAIQEEHFVDALILFEGLSNTFHMILDTMDRGLFKQIPMRQALGMGENAYADTAVNDLHGISAMLDAKARPGIVRIARRILRMDKAAGGTSRRPATFGDLIHAYSKARNNRAPGFRLNGHEFSTPYAGMIIEHLKRHDVSLTTPLAEIFTRW